MDKFELIWIFIRYQKQTLKRISRFNYYNLKEYKRYARANALFKQKLN